MRRLLAPLPAIILLAVLLAGWEAACRLLEVPTYFLPAPSEIAGAMGGNAAMLVSAAWITLSTALVALVICSLVATGFAFLLSLSPMLERAFQPLAVAVQVTPVVAVAPIAVIWAGLDHPERAVVGLAIVVAFFPIFSGALTGLRAADPDLERLFDLYGASRWQKLTRLRLPSAVPFLLQGHKVAAGQAVIGAVVAEFVAGSGAQQGLAWRMLEAGNRLQTAKVFAALFVLALMGGLLYAVLQGVERTILRWWRGR